MSTYTVTAAPFGGSPVSASFVETGASVPARGSGGHVPDVNAEFGANITVTEKSMDRHWFGGGHDLTLRRCVVGQITNGSYPIFQCRTASASTRIQRVTLDQCDYRDVRLPDHTEGLWFSGVDDFTFSDCRWWNNDVFNLALYAFPGAETAGCRDGLIERNWFGDGPRGGGRVWVGNAHNVTFRNCHFRVAPFVGRTWEGETVVSNIVFEDCVFGQFPVQNGGHTLVRCRVGAVSSTPPPPGPDGRLSLAL